MGSVVAELPPMPSNKPRISFVADDELKESLETLARNEARTVSNVVLLAVREYVAKAKAEGKLGDRSDQKNK